MFFLQPTPGGGRTNVWDSQNRLVSCTYNGQTSTFTYGADGLRRSMTTNGVTTNFALDGQNVVQEMQNGTYKATYINGARGVECRRDDTNGTYEWYMYDGLGSVIGEVDASGNVTYTAKYDVFGAVPAQAPASISLLEDWDIQLSPTPAD